MASRTQGQSGSVARAGSQQQQAPAARRGRKVAERGRWNKAITAGLASLSALSPFAQRSYADTTLHNGDLLDITPTASTALAGLSGRVFTGQAISDTAQINYAGTATAL